jgi:cytochrome c
VKNNLKKSISISLLALATFGSGYALASEELATSKGCLACHALADKKLGPSYSEVAAKYKEEDGAAETLTTSILKGSTGKWGGALPSMPPQTVSEEEAQSLATWILSL